MNASRGGAHATFHDWVLVRRLGVELGFTDSEYQQATASFRWGHGELLLTQAYFYVGFDDVLPFKGELPVGLRFEDSREAAGLKLAAFEASRHSGRSDTWDTDGYRLTATYDESAQRIDRLACRLMPAPLLPRSEPPRPGLAEITAAFGNDARSAEFLALWGEHIDSDKQQEAVDDGEIDLTQTCGATLNFGAQRRTRLFRSMTLHRNRDAESVGWPGAMPQGLSFEDSPETLLSKIPHEPLQRSDSAFTGHAVWSFEDYTLHVL